MPTIEVGRENDGRWIAEVPALPGTLAYGATEQEARSRVTVLAFRVIADLIERGEPAPREARPRRPRVSQWPEDRSGAS